MCPTLNVGDIVIMGSKSPENIKACEQDGDILILRGPQYFYANGVDPIMWNNLAIDTPIIHRAIDKKKIKDKWYFKTKGDNSWAPDGCFKIKEKETDYITAEFNESEIIYVPESEVLGVVMKRIPINETNYQLSKSPDFLLDIDMFERMEVKVFLKK